MTTATHQNVELCVAIQTECDKVCSLWHFLMYATSSETPWQAQIWSLWHQLFAWSMNWPLRSFLFSLSSSLSLIHSGALSLSPRVESRDKLSRLSPSRRLHLHCAHLLSLSRIHECSMAELGEREMEGDSWKKEFSDFFRTSMHHTESHNSAQAVFSRFLGVKDRKNRSQSGLNNCQEMNKKQVNVLGC